MSSLVLHDNAFSPYAFKLRAFLYEKGIAHTKDELTKGSQRAGLLSINPRGEIPAITHGDVRLYDSTVVCEYLEELFPEPALAPADAAGRAHMRLLEKLADGPLDGCVISLAIPKFFAPELEKDNPEVVEAAIAKLGEFYGYLEAELGQREFFCGELSRADLALLIQVGSGQVLGATLGPEHPRLTAWLGRMNTRPAVQRAMAEFLEASRAGREDDDPFFSRDTVHLRDHRIEWGLRVGLRDWLVKTLDSGRAHFSPVP